MDLIKCIEFVNKGTGAFEITNGADRYVCRYEHRSGTGENKMPARWIVSLDGQDGEEMLAMPKAGVVEFLEERLVTPGKKQAVDGRDVAVVSVSMPALCGADRDSVLARMAAEECGVDPDGVRMTDMRVVALEPDTSMFYIRVELQSARG